MDEPPAAALRGKKDSSMRVAVNLVKNGTAHACVSAGNTGALMAISRFVLKMLPDIERPAICSVLPTLKGHTYVLDLGANVDCTAEHLLQFGVMGATLVSSVENKEQPSVGLLNIGEEDIKGNEVVKRAAELLRASGLNFYGNVEGDDIYKGTTDVVVCDGFVGNVALKTSEGLAQMLEHLPARRIQPQRADPACGRGGAAGDQRVQAPRRSAPLQRREPARACAASWSRATARPTGFRSASRSAARSTRRAAAC